MIHHLQGRVVDVFSNRLILELGGLGYEVHTPLGAFELSSTLGKELKVLVHHHQTEAGQTLYGFASAAQRDLFRLLIERVSGVGPKVALAVLGGLSLEQFRRCVLESDAQTLSQVKGLGLKTAQRILLELTDKVGLDQAWAEGSAQQPSLPNQAQTTVLALLALGYKQTAADKAARTALQEQPEGTEEELLRKALLLLR